MLLAYTLHETLPHLALVHAFGIAALGIAVGTRWQFTSQQIEWRGLRPSLEWHPIGIAVPAAAAGAAWGFFTAVSVADFSVGFAVYVIQVMMWRDLALSRHLEPHIVNQCIAISGAALVVGAAFGCGVL